MPRPKYNPSPDKNHSLPMEYLRDRCGGFESHKDGLTVAYTANYRGYPILLIDLSKFGGVLTDWIIQSPETDKTVWIECKTAEAYEKPDHDMTDGEKWLYAKTRLFTFCVIDEDMESILEFLINE